MIVASVACGAPARPASTPDSVTVEPGPPSFEAQPVRLPVWSWDEYRERTAPFASLARLARPHPRASSAARYGINLQSGAGNASWVFDGDPATGYWLAVDSDLDGDVANDRIWKLQRATADWRVEVATVPRVAGAPPTRFVVAFDGTDVQAYSTTIRAGTITVEGRPLRFAIACLHGDCGNTEWVRIGFDLDGDGAVDLASPGSYECYALRDRTVVAFERGYDFEIATDGSRLTLRRTRSVHAPRPTLLPGSMAPAFDAVGRDARFSLATARGRVVLIDFFSVGCPFCIEDLPWLAGVHDRYASAGLDIVTIAAGTAPPVAHHWPTIVEEDSGPVATLFRVNAYPTYFVVDRDGTIACARCKHEDVDQALARIFARRPADPSQQPGVSQRRE